MRRGLLFAAALTLQACASAPASPVDATPPQPAAWRAAAATTEAGVVLDWWRSFGDPDLAAAVETALAANLDLKVAAARVREAEALSKQARAAQLPALQAVASAQDARSLGALGSPIDTVTAQPQLQAAYEVDLWGRLRSANAAATASLQASRYSLDAARLSVAAATARTYITLVSLDAQLDVARRTLAAREDGLKLAVRRADNGVTSRLERAQAQSERDAAAQSVPALILAVRRQENALEVLMGALPRAPTRHSLAALTPPAIQPGLPSTLLERRPDIASAAANLTAADASLASAHAALLPQVRLTGTLGELFVEHLDPVGVWTMGGSTLATLFDGGRLSGQVNAAAARRDQAAYAYKGAVLNAFAETEAALEGAIQLADQLAAAEAQQASVTDALKHATNRYRAGYATYLEQLDAQRGLLAAELTIAQLRETQLLTAVGLYQALGGGWSSSEPRALAQAPS